MKKVLVIILCVFGFFVSKSQTIRINKYLVDSMLSPNIHILYFDSAHNGAWQPMSTRAFAQAQGGGGGSGTVTSVTGTSNRITITGTPTVNPTVDIAATYVGQTSITTLGTIGTGVWNGTPITNSFLQNSTISGISLGSNLNNLSVGFGFLFASGSSYNGATARTILADSNIAGLTTWARTKKVTDSLGALIGASGISGSGAANQIVFWTGTSTVSGSSSFKYISADNSIEWGTGDVVSGFTGALAMAGSVARDNNAIVLSTNAIDSSSNTAILGGQNTVIYESANGSVSLATDGTIRRSAAYALIANDANEAWGESSSTFGFGNDNFVTNGFLAGNSNVLGSLTTGNGNSRSNLYTDSWMIGTSNLSTGNYNGTLGYAITNTGVKSYVIGSGGSGNLTFGWTNAIGLGTNSDSATVIIKPAAGTTGTYGETMVRGDLTLTNNTSYYNTTAVMVVMDSVTKKTYHQSIPSTAQTFITDAITADQNNYNPTGLSTATAIRISSDNNRNITGLTAQSSGTLITIYNVGSFPITLKNENSSSSAANRFTFSLPTYPVIIDAVIESGRSLQLQYDGTTSRWRIKSSIGTELNGSLYTAVRKRGEPVGTLYSKTGFTSGDVTSDFDVTGSATSVVNNMIVSDGVLGNIFKLKNYYTMFTRWTLKLGFKPGTKTSNTYGMLLGMYSANSTFIYNTYGQINLRTTPSAYSGTMELQNFDGSNSPVLLKTLNALSWSAGDSLVFTVTRNVNKFTITAYNQTTHSATLSETYEFNGEQYPHNTSQPFFRISTDGINATPDSIYHFSFYSDESYNPSIMLQSDSKGIWYPGNVSEMIPSLLNEQYENTINHSGSGDKTRESVLTTTEVTDYINPDVVIYTLGSNDIRYGINIDTTKKNIDTVYNRYTRAGIKVYFALMYESSISQTTLRAWLQSNYPDNYIDAGYIATRDQWTSCNSGDGIHMNAYGNNLWTKETMTDGRVTGNRQEMFQDVGTVVPNTPPSTYGSVYLREDSLRFKNDAGTEFTLGTNASGSVTSVATNNGTGLTGGTITTSGTLAIDTNLVATRLRVQKGIDSLAAIAGGGVSSVSVVDANGFTGSVANPTSTPAITLNNNSVNFQSWYTVRSEFAGAAYEAGLQWVSTGTGSSAGGQNSGLAAGWIGGLKLSTGTTTSGAAGVQYYSGSSYAEINLDNSIRSNVGFKVRLEDLSDGTDTYSAVMGFGDEWAAVPANIVDGVYFRYTSADSSGKWICVTESNNSKTERASSITVAADTDYTMEISVFGGNAYFYINKTLVQTLTTNIPTGDTRRTSAICSIAKSAGTTSRDMFVDWGALGTRSD